MQDNKIHSTPWTPNPESETELFCEDIMSRFYVIKGEEK